MKNIHKKMIEDKNKEIYRLKKEIELLKMKMKKDEAYEDYHRNRSQQNFKDIE
jgi:hypothetical protein